MTPEEALRPRPAQEAILRGVASHGYGRYPSDRRALDVVLELIRDAGRTYSRVDGGARRSLNQAWFDHLMIDEEDGEIHVADAGRSELTAALQTAVGRVRRRDPLNEQRRRSGCYDGVDSAGVSNMNFWWS